MVMPINLAQWQKRLEIHFRELSTHRKKLVPDRRIFVLEHGLDQSEVEALATAVRDHIVVKPPLREHALAWIVYSAEIGYRYSGDEYWQTFEQETPGWIVNGDRYWIRDLYLWFQKEFHGVMPSGAWAKHFSIICWPITHAVLPRDLQRQLARILYELRHSLSAELLESPSTFGDFIAARSWNATSRFQNFAQETQLVGQIATALLLEGEFGTDNLIHPATLRRIGGDLDRERRAREWLRGARRFAKDRARLRGLTFNRSMTPFRVSHLEETRSEIAALGIEPRLVIRPKNQTGDSWEVLIEIPNLSHLLFRFPKTRDILTGSRCVVAGATGRPLARGRCLYGMQRVIMSRWPNADELLLQFEQTDPQLEYLLRAECLLRPGPTWLFKIASDGLAYERRSLRVRPGERYLIVSTGDPFRSNGHAKPIDLQCEKVHAAILELPQALSSDWEESLRHLGLGQAKTIEVWPAGLSAVVWDGEGRGEWLASERPCLAIRTDHQIEALVVSMDGNAESSLELTPIEPGIPVFVELPQLPVGLHKVHVCSRTGPETEDELIGDLDVVMRIREARPWSPGVSPHGPLVVDMDPAAPTLEQLWEGRVEIALRGPQSRPVSCTISLYNADSVPPTVRKQLPLLVLPVTPATWRLHFKKHFQDTREVPFAYDIARICEIEFAAEELGAFTVHCEREFTPLRWAVRRDGQCFIVHLFDDSGEVNQPKVVRLAFESPCVEEPLDPASMYAVPKVGGLYVARQMEFTAAIIIPPSSVRGLRDLRCIPRIDVRERSADSVLRIVAISRLWARARLPGDLLSAIRQRDVLHAFTHQVFRILCGDKWAKAEEAVSRGSKVEVLKRALSHRDKEAAIGETLARNCHAVTDAVDRERVRQFALLMTRVLSLPPSPAEEVKLGRGVVRRRKPANYQNPEWLSELALRLASDPADVGTWAGERLRAGVTRLLEVPTLARAARFFVLTVDRHLQSQIAPGELYSGWRWT